MYLPMMEEVPDDSQLFFFLIEQGNILSWVAK